MRRALVVLVLVACGPKGGVHMAGDPDNLTRFPLNPPLAGTPLAVKGYLGVEIQPGTEAKGPLKSLTSTADADTLVWTLVVADPTGDKTATVRVPAQLGFPAKVGDVVELKLHTYGGGPNVIPQIVLLDAKGGVLIAINDRPPGWGADKARHTKLETGSTDDEETFTVKIGPSGDAEVDDQLREVQIAGQKFYAQGSSVVRHLHGDTAPADWVGSWTDFGVIRAQTVTPGAATSTAATTTATTTPTPDAKSDAKPGDAALVTPEKDPAKIQGYARVTRQNEAFRADVIVVSIATDKADERVLWTVALSEDPFVKARPKQFTLRVELPPQIALPLQKNDRAKVDVLAHGGGPNMRYSLLVTGDKGLVIMAIDQLPPGWEADNGKKLRTEAGEPYDEVTYAVKLGPKGKQVNLDGNAWRAATIDGVHYVGTATAVERKLHKGKMKPPDYVGGWTDFTLVRVP